MAVSIEALEIRKLCRPILTPPLLRNPGTRLLRVLGALVAPVFCTEPHLARGRITRPIDPAEDGAETARGAPRAAGDNGSAEAGT